MFTTTGAVRGAAAAGVLVWALGPALAAGVALRDDPGLQAAPPSTAPGQPAGGAPQGGPRPRDPHAVTYATYCAGCHGSTLSGGRAPTLLDDEWRYGADDASVLRSIREGRPGTEMPPFKEALSEAEIQGLLGYLRSQAVLARNSAARAQRPGGQTVASERHAFRFEVVAEGLATPWGMAFLPDGRMLVTERTGALRVIEHGKLDPKPIEGLPAVWGQQDGGLFDVEIDPAFARNGWIYLSYAEAGENASSMTVVIRGRVKGGRWVDQEFVYRPPAGMFWAANVHYGSRFIFDRDGRLFYSIGDRGREADAQDLSKPNGKVHRVNPDGSVPRDNPFAGRAGALASIWSYGHRNPQGFAFHPVTGRLWSSEHGPMGGDELNRVEPGRNYGWPVVHFGKIPPPRPGAAPAPPPPAGPPPSTEGMEPPVVHWTPSIAPSGITFYTGDRFPRWKNHLFVTGLGGEALRRLETDGDTVVHQEVVFKGFGRVRDVVTGPDGCLYVALSVPGVRVSDTTPGMIVRLVPADGGKADGAGDPGRKP